MKSKKILFVLSLCLLSLIGCTKNEDSSLKPSQGDTSQTTDITSNSPSSVGDSSEGNSSEGTSSNENTSSEGTTSSEENPPKKELVYDVTLPTVEDDDFTFTSKQFKEIPVEYTPTEDEKVYYELSADQTYYIVHGEGKYEINEETGEREKVLIDPYRGSSVVIKDYIDGKPVKEIAGEAFAYNGNLVSAYIPSTIETFGAGVFNSCPKLTTIYYDAANVNDLPGRNWAFLPVSNATNKIDVYFGPNVKRIPNRLFFPLGTETERNPNIQNVYFSKDAKITSIGDYAFYNLKNAVIHDMPDTIESIGTKAFYNNKTENLNLPTALKSIGESAFEANLNLKHVQFGNQLDTISMNAFRDCYELVSVDLSTTKLETIGENAFRGNEKLKKITFPETLNRIAASAFEGNSSLEVLSFPSTLTSIGEAAFKDATALKAIELNENLKTIENSAFMNATSVSKLVVKSTALDDFNKGNNIFTSLGKEESGVEVIFTNTVNKIPARMFFPSSNEDLDPNLTRVVLLKSVKEIHDYAFFELNIETLDYEGSQSEFELINMHNNTFTDVNYYEQ